MSGILEFRIVFVDTFCKIKDVQRDDNQPYGDVTLCSSVDLIGIKLGGVQPGLCYYELDASHKSTSGLSYTYGCWSKFLYPGTAILRE